MKVFIEEQRFTQTWLVLIISISAILPIVIICNEYFKENTKMTTNEFLFSTLGIALSISIIFIFKLTTRIDEKGIYYQFFPFHFSLKLIPWRAIKLAYVRTYNPIAEYGGWGLKGGFPFNKKNGKAINISGNIGIQLELKNGKKLLIGTQKETEIKLVLQKYKNLFLNN